jgi:DNA invertase Pin-like site-specific DNA recombinase
MANGDFISYLRVSTNRQGESGLGVDAQRAAVNAYLNGGAWRVVEEFVEVESGRHSERPVLAKALAAARLRQIPLVVAKVDRLTRSAAFLHRLIEAGVDVRFADLPQIEGPTGRFLLQQMVSVAELEAGMIAKRTKDALAAAKLRGTKLGGLREGQYINDDIRAESIKTRRKKAIQRAEDIEPIIDELNAKGWVSFNAVAKELTKRQIPTPRGKSKWSAVQVMRLMEHLMDVPGK